MKTMFKFANMRCHLAAKLCRMLFLSEKLFLGKKKSFRTFSKKTFNFLNNAKALCKKTAGPGEASPGWGLMGEKPLPELRDSVPDRALIKIVLICLAFSNCTVAAGATFAEELKSKQRIKTQLIETLEENHRLIFKGAAEQLTKLYHLDKYFNQRLKLVKVETEQAIDDVKTASENQQVLAREQLALALSDLNKQSHSSSKIIQDQDPADFVRTILQIRNMLPREPEMVQKLHSTMPAQTIQIWSQQLLNNDFAIQITKTHKVTFGLTACVYALGTNKAGNQVLIRASVETNDETKGLFVSNWTETSDKNLINRTIKLIEKHVGTKA